MDVQQAKSLLTAEIASGSPVGKALLVALKHAELEVYRTSRRAADPIAMARACGQGEGIHHFATSIAPPSAAAPTGRLAAPGAA